ncbi:50S ribosomal protein L15 [candidate division KSB1 bacterium]|nr:50S ribosomal protein L15 [candidate division KSB1 bacterium]RQW05829.1 MAG: 50S ribosomal protein L15 [candidate division KSB1 bacterium]
MDLSNLKYAEGSRKNRKRVGRGGAHGKTACRGSNGQRSRSGAKRRLWFEGGQMPIMRRLPKRGFTNFNRIEYQIVNVGELEKIQNVEEITPDILRERGLVSKKSVPVKILGNGEIKSKVNIVANAFSKTAIEKITAAGGRTTTL